MKIFLLFGLVILVIADEPNISPTLQNTLRQTGKANIMITMAESTDGVIDSINQQRFNSRSERLNALATELETHSNISQARTLNILNLFSGIKVTSYWISNQIFVKNASVLIINALKLLPEIESIEQEKFYHIYNPIIVGNSTSSTFERQNGQNTYGVKKIHAPEVWAKGYEGKDIVVANIDTGVRCSHSALKSRWRSDEYGWYDPECVVSLLCKKPTDLNGHGTHTMGTICGSGGIGIAPGATWIACKGCDATGSCSNNVLTACGQWITCPTKYNGEDKDCSKAPHVVSNSWGGGSADTFYNGVIKAWMAGGIRYTFSDGNSGSEGCGSANSPADQVISFSIGATDANDKLAPYSSLGPAKKTNLIKPDIVAPGTEIVSASHKSDNGYIAMSGTSMASPHMAGVMALLLSKEESLTQNQLRSILTKTAQQTGLTGIGKNCSGKSEKEFPNNSFGYGRVDALAAINAVQ